MKWIFLFLMIFVARPAFASAETGESRFHLLATRCEPEVSDGPETTPQSPPLEVDDPSTPGCNRWEINIVVDGDIAKTQRNWELPLLDMNYGVGDNIQLKYEVPYLSSVSGESNAAAIGESIAGIKYMFFEDEKAKLQLATYPQLTFVRSNSDAVLKGLATPGAIVTIPALLSVKVGETSRGEVDLTADIGYNISTKADTADFVSASLGLGTALSHKIGVMGELTTQQAVATISDEARAQLVRADLGMMTTISQEFLLFGAVGHSLVASDSQDHAYVLVGFRVLAGGLGSRAESVVSNTTIGE